MTLSVRWFDADQRVILVETGEAFTLEALSAAIRDTGELVKAVDHPVCFLSDMRRCRNLPEGLLAYYPEIARVINHPNCRGAVLVGVQARLRFLTEIFSRVFRRLNYADTMEEGLEMVEGLLG
jgi:hypothetical protein